MPPTTTMIGRTLKHYAIETLLGRGGMGVVYKARDTKLERPVALKLLNPDLVADPDRKARFLREARAAAALNHPSVAQVYDIDDDGGTTFIAMEFVDGRTVGRLIADRELDLAGSVEIALQVAEGIARAHEANIIHRDIKSDNIMVTREGHAKLLDFGLAKLYDSDPHEGAEPFVNAPTMTRMPTRTSAGVVMGTIQYMSPEQARGQEVDPRSDIFSLGIVLYEMAAGELPFKGDSPLDTMHAIAFEEPGSPAGYPKSVPPELQAIIARCLEKRREDRYLDARALAADLRHLKRKIESGASLTLPAGARILEWLGGLRTSFRFGATGWIFLGLVAIALTAIFSGRIEVGTIVSNAFLGFFLYRYIRNRKSRLLRSFKKKASSIPEVQAILIRDNRVTVVIDKAPAKTYIRITGLIEEVNKRLFFGKPVTGEIIDDPGAPELKRLLRQPGTVFIREGALPESSPTADGAED
ncbi:MAG: serine/threonine-protein kinase [Candidatus Aminicenantales bacterium]